MRVVPEVSAATQTTIQVSTGVFATAFDVQTVETTCIVQDGETVCLGGMISTRDLKTENKVPWVGDLPWIGAAFRFRTQAKTKKELVCILTPHVMRNPLTRGENFVRNVTKMDWMLPEVAKIYGIESFAPILPPPGVGFQNPPPFLQQPDFAPPPRPGPGPNGGPEGQPHLIMPQWQIPGQQTLPPPQVLPPANPGGTQAMRPAQYDQSVRQ
jgi:Bacterial type II and III secretion system protein